MLLGMDQVYRSIDAVCCRKMRKCCWKHVLHLAFDRSSNAPVVIRTTLHANEGFSLILNGDLIEKRKYFPYELRDYILHVLVSEQFALVKDLELSLIAEYLVALPNNAEVFVDTSLAFHQGCTTEPKFYKNIAASSVSKPEYKNLRSLIENTRITGITAISKDILAIVDNHPRFREFCFFALADLVLYAETMPILDLVVSARIIMACVPCGAALSAEKKRVLRKIFNFIVSFSGCDIIASFVLNVRWFVENTLEVDCERLMGPFEKKRNISLLKSAPITISEASPLCCRQLIFTHRFYMSDCGDIQILPISKTTLVVNNFKSLTAWDFSNSSNLLLMRHSATLGISQAYAIQSLDGFHLIHSNEIICLDKHLNVATREARGTANGEQQYLYTDRLCAFTKHSNRLHIGDSSIVLPERCTGTDFRVYPRDLKCFVYAESEYLALINFRYMKVVFEYLGCFDSFAFEGSDSLLLAAQGASLRVSLYTMRSQSEGIPIGGKFIFISALAAVTSSELAIKTSNGWNPVHCRLKTPFIYATIIDGNKLLVVNQWGGTVLARLFS